MLLRDLQSASFKGAAFLCPEDDAEEGRNNILHRYPDASMLYAEDNGNMPPCFMIRGIVHGQGLQGKVAALRRAFSSPGPGVLRHPWYGTQFVAVDQTANFRRTDRNAGVIEFDVKLVVTGPPAFPGLASGIAAVVTGLSASAVTNLFAAFAKSVKVPTSTASLVALASSIKLIGDTMDNHFGSVSSTAYDIAGDASRYARTPSTLQVPMADAFRAPLNDTSLSAIDLLRGYKDVSDTSQALVEEASYIEVTTADRAARQKSLLALATTVEAAAFASIAEAMAGREYETGDQVDADEQDLVARFDAVQSRELDADLHDALQDILTATSEVLRDAAVRLPRLTEINVIDMPASVLSYQLYHGDMSLPDATETYVQRIVDLNLDQDPNVLTGAVSVLSEA
jgi:prophage DNA circulation protein